MRTLFIIPLVLMSLLSFRSNSYAQDIWTCVETKVTEIKPTSTFEYKSNEPRTLRWVNKDTFDLWSFGEFQRNKRSVWWNDKSFFRTAYLNQNAIPYTVIISEAVTYKNKFESVKVSLTVDDYKFKEQEIFPEPIKITFHYFAFFTNEDDGGGSGANMYVWVKGI